MKLVVNHLTRMKQRFICVAGIDTETGKHVRPLVPFSGFTRMQLLRRGGPFDIGSVVDLGAVKYAGRAPELEDHNFQKGHARRVGEEAAGDYWRRLEAVSQDTLADIFGPDLRPQGRTLALEPHKGEASLGCLALRSAASLHVDERGSIRIEFTDGEHTANAPVTDLRLHATDLETPEHELVRRVSERLEAGERAILSVGLTRPFQKSTDTTPRHWLQVNNIHLESDPLWRDCAR